MKSFLIACSFYCYNSLITHIPIYWIRHCYLRNVLRIQIGKNTSIHIGCFITGRNITIGENTVINRSSYLDGRAQLTIGSNVSISPHTFLISLDHDPQSSSFDTLATHVIIGDYVWIGVRATILPGVTIGNGCVVGAGAVVTKSFKAFSIVAGVPAKIIGERNKELNYNPKYFPLFNTDII